MEAVSCIKSVVAAANQYSCNCTDSNLEKLQRQIDVLTEVSRRTSVDSFFNTKDLLCVECMASMVDIMNNPHTKPSLAYKTMLLLNSLVTSTEVCDNLTRSYHLTATLAGYLRQHSSSDDPNLLMCVKLLQKISYGHRVSYEENYIEELIRYLTGIILGKESELTLPCLGVLSNLCRNNFSVQVNVKSLPGDHLRSLGMKLTSLLMHKNKLVVILSLSAITSLFLHEETGEKIFCARNISNIFQLLFNMMMKNDMKHTRSYAVDVFTDILKHPKNQQALIVYEHFKACLQQVLKIICEESIQDLARLLQFVLTLCRVSGLRAIVCRTLLECEGLQDPASYTRVHAQLPDTQPFLALLHWATQSSNSHQGAAMCALQLIREIYEELLEVGLAVTVSPRTDCILPLLTDMLVNPVMPDGITYRNNCLKTTKALQILHTLCSNDALRSQVAEAVDMATCVSVVEHQLNHNHVAVGQAKVTGYITHNEWSEAGIDVVLHMLGLLLDLDQHSGTTDSRISRLLQDVRLVPFLTVSLTSTQRERVNLALRLVGCASRLNDFPLVMLGDNISSYNTQPNKQDNEAVVAPAPSRGRWENMSDNKENVTPMSLVSDRTTASDDLEVTVQSLIDKMHNGMVLKDVNASDIISMYEHKLRSIQTKETHLEDLLEAKTLALAQADRLILQYRGRISRADTESQKMRGLLSGSERHTEQQQEELSDLKLEHERQQIDLEQFAQDNTRLEVIAHEHSELTDQYNDQAKRMEVVQRNLSSLKQEHQSLSEMHDMLQRHSEKLKQQHELVSSQLAELEEDKKTQSRHLKERDAKLQELGRNYARKEDELQKTRKEREEMEVALDKLRDDLTRTEKANKDLKHEVTTMEILCKEKEKLVTEQRTKIDHHNQIATLIHNLSSGKTPEVVPP